MKLTPLKLADGIAVNPPLWLAPMEGITDRSFRRLAVETNPDCIGAVCTEFVRVTNPPVGVENLQAELGDKFAGPLHGLQLMGNDPEVIAATARNAAEAGADYLDLNFGCPAPRVYQHCAGSALLDDPPALETLVKAVVAACPLPVTAKIRAGGTDDNALEEIARRVEQAGAVALCIHGRLRTQSYRDQCDWNRISRTVNAVMIPVIGNGGIDCHADIARMFDQTGCAGVMVGRAALADPWIFSGTQSSHAQRIAWLRTYTERMETNGAKPNQAMGRLKQAVKYMNNANQLELASELASCLRSSDKEEMFEKIG